MSKKKGIFMEVTSDILEDLFKIYLSSIDSYNAKILQTINEKYTIIDKNMLAVYLYMKILEDNKDKNKKAIEVLSNYMLKQLIYSETGNLSLEISDKSKVPYYTELLDRLILEKFEYKNRILKELKYNYKMIPHNEYSDLLIFCEDIAEYSILNKLYITGNREAEKNLTEKKNKILSLEFENEEENSIGNVSSNVNGTKKQKEKFKQKEIYTKDKKEIVNLIRDGKFENSVYGNLVSIALKLRDVYRYSTIIVTIPENVLFHQYTIAVTSLILAEYLNEKLGESIDIGAIIEKSLFHDFCEFKGNEIVTQFKNYNADTIKMFAEIEAEDENELKELLGINLYLIITNAKMGAEGYVLDMLDKMLGIMKLCIEIGYMNNLTCIRVYSIYQERFKRFLRVYKMDELKNKDFYIDLIRESYIYVKNFMIETNVEYFLKYFTEEELKEYRKEIKDLKENKELFLK
jgi:hypothetical protein